MGSLKESESRVDPLVLLKRFEYSICSRKKPLEPGEKVNLLVCQEVSARVALMPIQVNKVKSLSSGSCIFSGRATIRRGIQLEVVGLISYSLGSGLLKVI